MVDVVPRRVLIIDDNFELAENIAEILRMDGFATDVAASAEDAWLMTAAFAPDVVVTDYRLPGMNGANFVRQCRAAHLTVHAIVISAYTDDHTIKEATESGATFLAKPLDFKLLARTIREASA